MGQRLECPESRGRRSDPERARGEIRPRVQVQLVDRRRVAREDRDVVIGNESLEGPGRQHTGPPGALGQEHEDAAGGAQPICQGFRTRISTRATRSLELRRASVGEE